ncbi:MAG: histone deacetylase [Candidatus Krumholzibacteria bacterium]|nr:histone deacetylase [Candidatus Krumholzibacteria bacterium]
MIGVIWHELFTKHLEGYSHVECPQRVEAILKRIKKSPIASSLLFIEAEPAKIEWIERVHDHEYVKAILSLDIDEAVILDWGDTVATKASPAAALHAAGAGVQAASLVLDGKISSAFCCVRPPGHHAERNRAMGFCIFNNIAIAAAHLIEAEGLERVAIVDWDVHHGNGTERTFIDDDRVLYISLHQYPHYPGTGNSSTTGTGKGEGYTINLPMGAGAGDSDYLAAFRTCIIPALDDFKPEFILISAGFDGHEDDPLSSTVLTTSAFRTMTVLLKASAEKHCKGRIVSLLEGGYDIQALVESVEEHITALAT